MIAANAAHRYRPEKMHTDLVALGDEGSLAVAIFSARWSRTYQRSVRISEEVQVFFFDTRSTPALQNAIASLSGFSNVPILSRSQL
jgi:hypothetical protein